MVSPCLISNSLQPAAVELKSLLGKYVSRLLSTLWQEMLLGMLLLILNFQTVQVFLCHNLSRDVLFFEGLCGPRSGEGLCWPSCWVCHPAGEPSFSWEEEGKGKDVSGNKVGPVILTLVGVRRAEYMRLWLKNRRSSCLFWHLFIENAYRNAQLYELSQSKHTCVTTTEVRE